MPSIAIFALQIILFGALTLYLHHRSEDYGYAPLLFFAAGIMGILNLIELITIYIEPVPGIVIRPGGHVFVPIVLLIVLILYITSGTRTARIAITGLTGINVLIITVLLFLVAYVNVRDPATVVQGRLAEDAILTPLFLRGVAASTATFFVNMLVIIIVYQGIRNTFPRFPETVIPGIALLSALWVDSILYNILAFLGTPLFVQGIPGDVTMKTLAGLLLAPLAGWYLTHRAPRMSRYVGAADRPTLAILFGEDSFVSRLRQLEDELQVSRAIYEQIMQHIEEVFWLVDIERVRLLYISPNFETMTGQPPEAFYRNPAKLLELVYPDDRAENVIEQVFLSPETEFRIVHTDGSIRWLRNRSFPIMTHNEQIVRYAGITEDVTARREARAQAFALELSREKEKLLHRFVRDASHDLRTPLSSILLKLELLPLVDAKRQQELQGELRKIAQHLNDLIDDLFTLSRIEGEGNPIMAPVELDEIVRQVCEELRIVAQNKDLSLVLEMANQPISIRGNREQLFRLVSNLITNAINYTRQGSITLRASLAGNQATLEIADTGIGIPEDQLDAVFERFHRTAEARDVRQEGTGLGLAISKAIVEQHDGTITVRSAVGKGTTFRIVLPVNAEAEPHLQSEPSTA